VGFVSQFGKDKKINEEMTRNFTVRGRDEKHREIKPTNK